MFRFLEKISNSIYEMRTVIVFAVLLFFFGGQQRSDNQFIEFLIVCFSTFWVYSYTEVRRKYRRPHDPDTKAVLKVSTEPFVDWAVTTMQGGLVLSGWGSKTISLPKTGIRIERDSKVKYSEYVYVVEVTSGNGDAFASLTIDGDDEFLQTVACGRSGDPEVVYTCLNTAFGTRHWLIPDFFQGIPK